jgi:DMSO/TMAO reductase YedYZ heme-binding membrane subunit
MEATISTPKRSYMRSWLPALRMQLLATILWFAQFAYQYLILLDGELRGSLIRSFALTGTTLITLSLLSSVVFKFRPRLAKYWRVRRHLGVTGTIMIALHVMTATQFLFGGDIRAVYYSFNPLKNPIVFGGIAYPIFILLSITSTDWALRKIGGKHWKWIHRLVYVAYPASIFHFISINPALLKNIAGYTLLTLVGLTIVGHLYWTLRLSLRARFRSRYSQVALLLIIIIGIMGYFVDDAYLAPRRERAAVAAATTEMIAYMTENPNDPNTLDTPLTDEAAITASIERSGNFVNLNYMTAGTARLVRDAEGYALVFADDFATPDGPDLEIYLTKNSAPTSRNDIRQGIKVGSLRSIQGYQIYRLPGDIDPSAFNSVTIHCEAFNVPWSYAPFN